MSLVFNTDRQATNQAMDSKTYAKCFFDGVKAVKYELKFTDGLNFLLHKQVDAEVVTEYKRLCKEAEDEKEMALRIRKIKQKAERHPDYPKHPSGPYIFFLVDCHDILLKWDDGCNPTLSTVGNKWKGMNEAERLKYNEAAAADKIRYEKELKVFETKHPDLAC